MCHVKLQLFYVLKKIQHCVLKSKFKIIFKFNKTKFMERVFFYLLGQFQFDRKRNSKIILANDKITIRLIEIQAMGWQFHSIDILKAINRIKRMQPHLYSNWIKFNWPDTHRMKYASLFGGNYAKNQMMALLLNRDRKSLSIKFNTKTIILQNHEWWNANPFLEMKFLKFYKVFYSVFFLLWGERFGRFTKQCA